MARKKTADAAKDKAAKQKKLIIVLVAVMLLAVLYAVHTMSSLKSGPSGASKPQPVAAGSTPTTTPAPTTPAPVAPSLAGTPTPAVPPAATGDTTGTATGSDSSQLIAVVIPTADSGQLDSFSRFTGKDPFATSGGTSSGSSSGSSSGGTGSSGPAKTPPAPPTPPAPAPTSAVLSVNGTSEMVQSGGNFPLANPDAATNGLFQLVRLTATTATVSVVGGSYASGSQTLTLHINKPVTLVNTADGTRYTLLLYPQGTPAPAAAPAGGTATPPATTTTPSTGG